MTNQSFGEGAGNAYAFAVLAQCDSFSESRSLSVSYTLGGQATPGTDHDGQASGSVTVNVSPYGAYAYVPLNALRDNEVEGTESIQFSIQSGSGYTVGRHPYAYPGSYPGGGTQSTDGNATLSLGDDPPRVSVTASDAAAAESGTPPTNTGTFTFTRSGGNPNAGLTAGYTIAGDASPGVDYDALSGTVSFGPNQTSKPEVVKPVDDDRVEHSETVQVQVSASATNLVGTPSTASVTIADNEALVTVSLAAGAEGSEDPDPSEPAAGPKPVEFVVTRNGGSLSNSLEVRYHVSGGTASPSDFVTPSGTVTIAPGATSAIVEIVPVDDEIIEPIETVQLTLDPSPTGRYVFADPADPPRAEGSIADNERVDLVLDGYPEEMETSPGAIFELGGTFTPMTLDVPEVQGGGQVKLSLTSRADAVMVWRSATAGAAGTQVLGGSVTEASWAAGSEPDTLYVQGIGITDTLASIGLLLAAEPATATIPATRATDAANGANEGVRIEFRGVDKTDQITDVLIGQLIDPVAQVSNPRGAAVTYLWDPPPGDTFKNYEATATRGAVTELAAEDLDDAQVRFYWADSGAANPSLKTVKVTAVIGGTSFPATTKFDVYEPSVDTKIRKGSIKVHTNPDGHVSLGFMANTLDENHPTDGYWGGFDFSGKVEVPAGFAQGEWGVVQLAELRRERLLSDGTLQRNFHFGERLYEGDNFPTFPAGGATWPTGPNYPRGAADSPSTHGLHETVQHNGQPTTITWTKAADEFDAYIMFKPAGGQWVPLRKIHWHWSAEAAPVNGVWTLTPGTDNADILSPVQWNEHPEWDQGPYRDEWVDA